MDRPAYEPEQEVRFAIVMYGGVSLAIYINGVAQELFRLVRATAPGRDGESLHLADDELSGSEAVYRELGRRLGQEGSWGEPGAVRSRFVVDILSGTSAGGINAIFLAKALANGQEIDRLRRLWIEEGDIALLFNEPRAYRGLPVEYSAPPPSLLAGERLYVRALEALRAMGAQRADGAPSYAEQVDLAVTTTDLQGLPLPIRLADGSVNEPRHRTVLRFVYATEDATGDERNDFEHRDELLAFAARATSSFPFAFEPVVLRDVEEVTPGSLDAIQSEGRRFFPDYASTPQYEDFAFADGGYLDNKPFTHATDTLRRRRADVPVDRKVLYIEPSPEDVPADQPVVVRPRPDAVANVAAALVGLPRVETIRDDIAALIERNAAIERVRRVTRGVELAALAPGVEAEPPPALLLAYRRLRRLDVLDDLAVLVTRAAGLPGGGDEEAAVRLMLDAWAPEEEGMALESFLVLYDLRYRLRRLSLLQDRIDDLLAGGREADLLLNAAGSTLSGAEAASAGREWLLARKRRLSEIFVELRRAGREARAREGEAVPQIGTAAASLRLDRDDLASIAAAGDPAARAAYLLTVPERSEAVAEFASALTLHFAGPFAEADAALASELAAPGPAPAGDLSSLLVSYLGCSEVVDMTLFPLTYPSLGEVNPVEVFRVSPDDAQSLVPVAEDGPPRLAGTAVGNFGGFLDEGWRRSDLLWGRLDGAERLLDALVPDDAARAELRTRAHAAILREELLGDESGALAALLNEAGQQQLPAVLAAGSDTDLVDLFKGCYRGPPRRLPPARELKLAGRGVAITGDVLEGVAKGRSVPSTPMFWLARIGRLLWGFVELAVPSTVRARPFYRYWRQLAFLLAAILIVVGVVAGVDGAEESGWLLAGGTALVTFVGWLLDGMIGKRLLLILAVSAALAIVTLAGVELVRHAEDDAADLWDWAADRF